MAFAHAWRQRVDSGCSLLAVRGAASASRPDETARAPSLTEKMRAMPATERLRKRSEFVAVRKGRRADSVGFTLQSAPTVPSAADAGVAAVGYTVTKKIGKAVERNRIRRRLREVVRLGGSAALKPGHRYVLVARREALTLPFEQLVSGLVQAAARVHAPRDPKHSSRRAQALQGQAPHTRSPLPDDSRQPDRTR